MNSWATDLQPIVGHWYSHRDKGALFQIVALDETAGTIEIQEFDGGLDELDLDEWRTLLVETAAQPETGAARSTMSSPMNSGYTDLTDEFKASSPEEAITTWEQIVEDDDFDEPIH